MIRAAASCCAVLPLLAGCLSSMDTAAEPRLLKAWEMAVAADEAGIVCGATAPAGWDLRTLRADVAARAPQADLDALDRFVRGKMRRFIEADGCSHPDVVGVAARRGRYAGQGIDAVLAELGS